MKYQILPFPFSRSGSLGFSLVGVIIGSAILGILTLAFLSITRSMTAMLTSGEINSEVNNQMYELKIALLDATTCSKNLSGVSLSTESVLVANPIRPLAPGTTQLDSTRTVLPVVGGGLRAYAETVKLLRNLGDAHLARVQIEFKNQTGTGMASYVRTLPIYVNLDASQKVIDCTSGSPTGGGGAAPTLATFGNCDAAPASDGMAPTPTRKAATAKICLALTYPTGAQNTIPCSVVNDAMYGLNQSGGGLSYDPLIPYAGSGSTYCSTSGANNVSLSQMYANLSSLSDCQNLPAYPQGSTAASSGGAGLTCISGGWVKTIQPVGAAAP